MTPVLMPHVPVYAGRVRQQHSPWQWSRAGRGTARGPAVAAKLWAAPLLSSLLVLSWREMDARGVLSAMGLPEAMGLQDTTAPIEAKQSQHL